MSDLHTRLQAALGDYRIDRRVGEGGMAVVFLALDPKHDRRVAVKVMKPDLGGSEARHRFLREIDVAAKLSHPTSFPSTIRERSTASTTSSCRSWRTSRFGTG